MGLITAGLNSKQETTEKCSYRGGFNDVTCVFMQFHWVFRSFLGVSLEYISFREDYVGFTSFLFIKAVVQYIPVHFDQRIF